MKYANQCDAAMVAPAVAAVTAPATPPASVGTPIPGQPGMCQPRRRMDDLAPRRPVPCESVDVVR